MREAHPTDECPQPRTLKEKLALARRYQERDGVPWRIAVDDVPGRFHNALGGHPNTAYLVGTDGRITHQFRWSDNERGLRSALEAVAAGGGPAGAT